MTARVTALPVAPQDPTPPWPRGMQGRVGRPLPREVIRDGKWTSFSPRPQVELYTRLDPGARARFVFVTGRTPRGPWNESPDPAIVIDSPGETVRVVDLAFSASGTYSHYAVAANVQGSGEAGATYLLTEQQAAELAALATEQIDNISAAIAASAT